MDAVKDYDAGVSADFLVRLRIAGQPPRALARARLTPVRVVDPRYVVHAVLMGPRRDLSDAPRSVNPRSWERDFLSRSKLRIRGRER